MKIAWYTAYKWYNVHDWYDWIPIPAYALAGGLLIGWTLHSSTLVSQSKQHPPVLVLTTQQLDSGGQP